MTSLVTLRALPFITTAIRSVAGGALRDRSDIGDRVSGMGIRYHRPAPRVVPRSRVYDCPGHAKGRPMHFVDECLLIVEAGDGGKGAIAFRREKLEPFG